MLDTRYRVVETGDYKLIGALINQMDDQGYRPILMSQVVKVTNYDRHQTVTTIVFEREMKVVFEGTDMVAAALKGVSYAPESVGQ